MIIEVCTRLCDHDTLYIYTNGLHKSIEIPKYHAQVLSDPSTWETATTIDAVVGALLFSLYLRNSLAFDKETTLQIMESIPNTDTKRFSKICHKMMEAFPIQVEYIGLKSR